MLANYSGHICDDWQRLESAGQALDSIIDIWRKHTWTVPAHDRKKAMELDVRHVALMAPYDAYIPKHHIFFHLLARTEYQGNPLVYATWLDESLNKVLKQCCKNAGASTFYETTLLKLRELLRDA